MKRMTLRLSGWNWYGVVVALVFSMPASGASQKSKAEEAFDEIAKEPAGGDDAGESTEFGAPARELPSDARVEDIVEPSADYHYAGFGKADPFQPPLTIKAIVPDAVEIPIVSPLQRYPLKELKLVGVWARSPGERKALVMTPGMEGIIVRVGDLAGSGGGKVMSIDEGSVLVREFLIANDGTRQFSDVRLVFDAGNKSTVQAVSGGSIVIAPGAAKPDVQLPAGAVNPVGAPPANQTPANLLPAIQQSPAAAAGGAQQAAPAATQGNRGATGTGGVTTPAATPAQQQGAIPVFNF